VSERSAERLVGAECPGFGTDRCICMGAWGSRDHGEEGLLSLLMG
jgi:hypothetical protein